MNNTEIEETPEEIKEVQVVEKATTACEHYWVVEGSNSGMTSVICNKCWGGAQFDPNSAKVVEGKLIWL